MNTISSDVMQTLLGRVLKEPSNTLTSKLGGSTALVTGAGGSIGSELCVQLIALGVKTLIMVDKDEFSLYSTDRKLREKGTLSQIVPVLSSIIDKLKLSRLLQVFRVDYVFHAAAYKHVPMVERNPSAGLQNNSLGTRDLAEVCLNSNIKKFVLVSTDKAVNPTNIMGASKRLAEYATLCQDDRFSVVRFGNVLWSSGSVLPLFYSQLKSKKPVTLTHKDVTRYFMAISEAVMLMMESVFIEGRIKVLNMGEQVKISELAARLAKCMGVVDYEIKFVGLRNGEKLYEELTLGINLAPSTHPDIQLANEDYPDKKTTYNNLTIIETLCNSNDIGSIRALLQNIVPGYMPVCGIVDDLWIQEQYSKTMLDDCFEYNK